MSHTVIILVGCPSLGTPDPPQLPQYNSHALFSPISHMHREPFVFDVQHTIYEYIAPLLQGIYTFFFMN